MRVGGLPAVVMAHIEDRDYRAVQSLIFASQREDFYRKEKLKDYLFVSAMEAVAKQLGNPSNLSHITPVYREATQVSGVHYSLIDRMRIAI
jgi:hypothetical protein